MARATKAILTNLAYAKNRAEGMLSLDYGGQFGYAPEFSEWVSSQAYVQHNLFCYLLEGPKFFRNMPDSEKWYSGLKSLVETHAQSIEGLNSKLTVDTDAHPVGGAGEEMDEPTNVKRAKSDITFNFGKEKYGMPITTFFYNWICYGIMDPDTKYALANTIENPNSPANDWLADNYSMTCLFIEPDPQHKRVVKAWLTTNMYPKETPEINGKRDLTGGMSTLDVSIPFTGITQYSLGVNVLAQQILNKISITQANPYLRAAFIEEQVKRKFIQTGKEHVYHGEIDKANEAAKDELRAGTGYNKEIETLVNSANNVKEELENSDFYIKDDSQRQAYEETQIQR